MTREARSLHRRLDEIRESFLPAYETCEKPRITFNELLDVNFDSKTTIACRSCLPMPQLNPDGSVSSCDMRSTATQKNSSAYLWVWNPGRDMINYYPDKIEILRPAAPRQFTAL